MSSRPPTDADLEAAAQRLGRALVRRGWQMASAESCTGGLIGHVITQIPKASDHYLGGIISYSNAVKDDLLGVPEELIERVGAVSAEVAEGMTTGVLARFGVARLAVGVTGIAGPDSGTQDKPVGLTYVAAALRDGRVVVQRHTWPPNLAGYNAATRWRSWTSTPAWGRTRRQRFWVC